MIVVYLFVLVSLAVVHFLVRRRVSRLERRFTAISAQADALLRESNYRGGNCCRPDPYKAAKRQYELAQLAMKRDRIENRYTSWQSLAERFAGFRRRLTSYRGRLLPYVVGVLDVAAVMVVLDQFGVGLPNLKAMLGI